MYELQNSINWHMYFYKPKVDVKVSISKYASVSIGFTHINK